MAASLTLLHSFTVPLVTLKGLFTYGPALPNKWESREGREEDLVITAAPLAPATCQAGPSASHLWLHLILTTAPGGRFWPHEQKRKLRLKWELMMAPKVTQMKSKDSKISSKIQEVVKEVCCRGS